MSGEKVLVVRHTGGEIDWDPSRDIWLHEELVKVTADCPPADGYACVDNLCTWNYQ